MTTEPLTPKPCPWCDRTPADRLSTDNGTEVRCQTPSCPGGLLPWLPVHAWNERLSDRPLLFGYDGPAYMRPIQRGLVLLDDPNQLQVEEVLPEGKYHVHLELRPRGDA